MAVLFSLNVSAQNYNNVLNYYLNATPNYGVKIKTNLPFTPGTYMPTIHISGYNYAGQEPIDLSMVFYLYTSDYSNPRATYVHNSGVSSAGSYTPTIYLGNENGKVIIYINDKIYHQRFTVSVFNNYGENQDSWYQGWTAVDEPFNGTQTVEVLYRNRFKGDVFLSGNGIWSTNGNVGIGTTAPTEKLAVNGNIRAKEIKVENSNWPDYVFTNTYQLPTLEETEQQILKLGHLPGIPSAAEVKEKGINLGDLNAKLLQKLEEVTLHLIELKKNNDKQQKAITNQNLVIQNLELKIQRLTK